MGNAVIPVLAAIDTYEYTCSKANFAPANHKNVWVRAQDVPMHTFDLACKFGMIVLACKYADLVFLNRKHESDIIRNMKHKYHIRHWKTNITIPIVWETACSFFTQGVTGYVQLSVGLGKDKESLTLWKW